MSAFFKELKTGVRSLLRQPLFSLVVVAILGAGVAALVTGFALVEAVYLRYPNISDPTRVVMISGRRGQAATPTAISPVELQAWQQQAVELGSQFTAYTTETLILTGVGDPEPVRAASVTANFVSFAGISIRSGRAIGTSDAGTPVALVSESLWRRKFGEEEFAPRLLRLNDSFIEIVGVVHDCCGYPENADIWRLFSPATVGAGATVRFLTVLARLTSPLVGPDQLAASLMGINRRLASEFPTLNDIRVVVMPIKQQMLGNAPRAAIAAFAGLSVLMLLACASAGHMLLARALSRRGELAVMVAIGAPLNRVVRHICFDGVLLAIASGILGGIGGAWTISVLKAWAIGDLPAFAQPSFSPVVLMFAIGLSGLTLLLVSLPTAVAVIATDPITHLYRNSLTSVRQNPRRIQRLLLSLQFGAAFALLLAASLMTKSVIKLSTADIGYSTDGLLTVSISLPATRYSQVQATGFFKELATELAQMPGVKAAAASSSMPLSGGTARRRVAEGGASDSGDRANQHVVTAAYFGTLGVPVIIGRDFVASDANPPNNVAIVNRSFESRYLRDRSALGQTIQLEDPLGKEEFTIIGVVPNFRDVSVAQPPTPQFYTVGARLSRATVLVAVRDDIGNAANMIRTAVLAKDANLFPSIKTVSSSADAVLTAPRRRVVISGVIAVFAFAIATAGIVGMVLFLISERRGEIAVRMSCGATPASVSRLFVISNLGCALLGVVGGAIVVALANEVLQTFLHDTQALDIGLFIGVAIFLLSSSAVAGVAGAVRVSSIQPQRLLTAPEL